MELFFKGHDYRYAVEQLMLLFFPGESPEYPDKASENSIAARVSLSRTEKSITSVCIVTVPGKGEFTGRAVSSIPENNSDALSQKRADQHTVTMACYRASKRATGFSPPWGAITGVRPTKQAAALIRGGMTPRQASRHLQKTLDVKKSRADLSLLTANYSLNIMKGLNKRDVCLYVGIPFCPTRCAYCSFVSQGTEKSSALIAPFFEALLKDVEATARAVNELGLRPVSLYLGGGTPTVLSEEQTQILFERLRGEFDLSAVTEIAAEAGRPDTITGRKLEALKNGGVTRISINPQTMDDRILRIIGRHHTAQDVYTAFETARKDFDFDINSDLIAGLPGDSPEGFRNTLNSIIALRPENITVHTLSLKKGSRIMLEKAPVPSGDEVSEMLSFSFERLGSEGYIPYYLYRQKYMSGAFENTAFTLPGKENIYNVCIMEELCSIISMGAGASSKLIGENRMQRFFSPKYPLEYINSIDKVCADKEIIRQFYGSSVSVE